MSKLKAAAWTLDIVERYMFNGRCKPVPDCQTDSNQSIPLISKSGKEPTQYIHVDKNRREKRKTNKQHILGFTSARHDGGGDDS